MDQTTIVYDVGSSRGVPSGSWTVPQVGNGSSSRVIRSVGYPIMAASVSTMLSTDSFQVNVPDAGGYRTVNLQKSLPTTQILMNMINAGIAEAYPSFAGELPQCVEKADGWYWTNPTSTSVDIILLSENMQQLLLGKQIHPTTAIIPVAPGTTAGPFIPDPRLGAVSQSLTMSPGQSYRLDLPLLGGYRDGVLFRPNQEYARLNSSINSARMVVSYPSISTTQTVTASVRSEIAIVSDVQNEE